MSHKMHFFMLDDTFYNPTPVHVHRSSPSLLLQRKKHLSSQKTFVVARAFLFVIGNRIGRGYIL